MSETELLSWLVVGGGGLAFIGLIVAFIRFMRTSNAIFPATAKKYGLTYSRVDTSELFGLGNTTNIERLQGVVHDIPISVESKYQTLGNTRMHRTVLVSRTHVGGLQPCTINVSTLRPAASVHLVPTGNAHFDARCWVTSDNPDIARSVLTPSVQEALLRFPRGEVQFILGGEGWTLAYYNSTSSQAELHALIDALLAVVRNNGIGVSNDERITKSTVPYLEQLGQAYGFTLDELQANRIGLVHPVQLARGSRAGFVEIIMLFILPRFNS